MKTTLAITIVLTGCADIAHFYDQRDPCQTRPELGRPAGYQAPSWCGAGGTGSTQQVIREYPSGQRVLTIDK